jgi:hypothetical protein
MGVLPILFRVSRGEKGLAKSMEELSMMARRMIEEEEVNVIILSDRGVTREYAPIPRCSRSPACTTTSSARACAPACRSCIETGDAREVHHLALLIGYGAPPSIPTSPSRRSTT